MGGMPNTSDKITRTMTAAAVMEKHPCAEHTPVNTHPCSVCGLVRLISANPPNTPRGHSEDTKVCQQWESARRLLVPDHRAASLWPPFLTQGGPRIILAL